MESEKEVAEVNIEPGKEVVEVNMEGEKERETKGNLSPGKETSEKYFERDRLALKAEECKQEYVAQLEPLRQNTQGSKEKTPRSIYA